MADFGKSSVAEVATVSFIQEKGKAKKVAEPVPVEETKAKAKASQAKAKAPAFEEVKGKGGNKPQQSAPQQPGPKKYGGI